MENAKSDNCRKNNSVQKIGTIKSSVSCTFDSYSQSRWTDK